MPVLLLRLAGPLQAWGSRSRFSVRSTESAPTKSGVIGLLAASVGRRRTDPIEDLLSLSFGVRKDQPGTVIRDFHTAKPLDGGRPLPLSTRYYLSDAVFLAGVHGDDELLMSLDDAVRRPAFPLYLGRRSCPPAYPVSLGLRDGSLIDALRDEPWLASDWFRRRCYAQGGFDAEVLVDDDAAGDAPAVDSRGQRDVPLTFDPRRRDYGFREVSRFIVRLNDGPTAQHHHDPMTELEEASRCS